MIHKRPLCPAKLRRVPKQFSWVDQRLVRERLHRFSSAIEACALYLFVHHRSRCPGPELSTPTAPSLSA